MREVVGLLRAIRPRRPDRPQPGLPRAPVLGGEPGEGVRVPRPLPWACPSARASATRRALSRPRRCGARRPARCARTCAGRSLLEIDPRRGPSAAAPSRPHRRAVSGRGIRGRPRLAGGGVRGDGAPRRDRAGRSSGTDRVGPRSSTAIACTTAAASWSRLVHVPGTAARAASVLLPRGPRGEDPPEDWAEVEARLSGGPRGRVLRPAWPGRDPHAIRGGLDRRPRAGAGRRGRRLREPGVRRPRQLRLQRAAPRPAVPLRRDRGRRDRGALRPRAARCRAVAIDAPGEARLLGRAVGSRRCPASSSSARHERGVVRLDARPSSRCARPGRSTTSCPAAPTLRLERPERRQETVKVLFLGGTGNISTACVEHALARGHQVGILNRGRTPSPFGPWVEVLRGDREDAAALDAGGGGRLGRGRGLPRATRRSRWTRRSPPSPGAPASTSSSARRPPTTGRTPACRSPKTPRSRTRSGSTRGSRSPARSACSRAHREGVGARSRSCGLPTPTARPGSPRASAGRTTRWWTACAAACRSSATATARPCGA